MKNKEVKPVEKLEVKSKRRVTRKAVLGLSAALVLVCVIVGIVNWNNGGKETADATDHTDTLVLGDLRTASDYEEIYQYMDAYWTELEKQNEGIELYGADTAGKSGDAIDTEQTMADSEYSETNIRQEGVDEADIVKTDGRYLCVLEDANDEIAVIDTANETMELVTEIAAKEDTLIEEFFVAGQKLVCILSEGVEYSGGVMPRSGSGNAGEAVVVRTYDISEPAAPSLLGEVSQSGRYTDARMVGDYVYLFTEACMNEGGKRNKPETYIPMVDGAVLEADDIFLPVTSGAYIYEIFSSVDVKEPENICDSKAVFTKGGQAYVSNENIYWYETAWYERTVTAIRKLSYADGKITGEAACEIDGYINDTFSIDEYKNYLRVITTDENSNSVYVLDENLETTGAIYDIAEDEVVYSARFMGDVGYFVTFRQMDPLFAVDFSEPTAPQIMGALKIPGFSEYLHAYGEGKLLGIGVDVDADTGIANGLKLSMFDIRDPFDVKEEAVYVMEDAYETDVFYDYKGVLIDEEKNMIGFSAYDNAGEDYYVFSYADGAFTKEMEEKVNGANYRSTRGVYIEDVLYVIKGNVVESYRMSGYEKLGDILI